MAKTNKVAIVTGSATGLGAACALELAERGWNIVINYTKSKKEAEASYAMVKAKGVEALLVQANVGEDADCRKLADETMKKWGRIDGLINNAGTTKFQNQGDLDGVGPEDFDRILRVNVTGPYMMSRAVFPAMKKQWEDKQERGAIVNISSISGKVGLIGQTNYSAAKAGIVGLTKAAAKEVAHLGVRINAIQPGLIRSAMTEAMPQRIWDAKLAEIPMARAGEPDEVANVALFLASDLSSYMTGTVLEVTGGRHI